MNSNSNYDAGTNGDSKPPVLVVAADGATESPFARIRTEIAEHLAQSRATMAALKGRLLAHIRTEQDDLDTMMAIALKRKLEVEEAKKLADELK